MFRGRPQQIARDLVSTTITRAFLISLLLHFAVIAGVELGNAAGFWKHTILPRPLRSTLHEEVKKLAEERQKLAEQRREEPPLIFVEVDPAEAIPEPPKDAKFYSTQSTLASNPDPKDLETPKIEGSQDKVPKTMDVMRPKPEEMKPAPPPPPRQTPKEQSKPSPKEPEPPKPIQPAAPQPKPAEKEGDMQMARAAPPQPKPQSQPQTPPKTRPRTLQEARAKKGLIEGQKMKQEGGAKRHSLATNLDVKATPFGSYDAAFIAAVQARWFSLLDERDFVRNQAGKVVLVFRLNKDGRITQMQVVESDVSDTLAWLCQRAVLDPAPYAPFPSDLRRLLNADYREVRFTFYYNN